MVRHDLGTWMVAPGWRLWRHLERNLRDSLSGCTALTHLTVALEQGPLHFHAAYLAAAPRLLSLSLTVFDPNEDPEAGSTSALEVEGLLALTALERLHLASITLEIGSSLPAAWGPWAAPRGPQPHDGLPPSMTSLALDGYADFMSSVPCFLPQQVSRGPGTPVGQAGRESAVSSGPRCYGCLGSSSSSHASAAPDSCGSLAGRLCPHSACRPLHFCHPPVHASPTAQLPPLPACSSPRSAAFAGWCWAMWLLAARLHRASCLACPAWKS